MGVNRVDFGGRTLIDISDTVVNPNTLCIDSVVYGPDGEPVIGANPYEKEATDEIVEEQYDLLEEALRRLGNKTAGSGSGGNSSPFTAAEEFIWTVPYDISEDSSVTIPHSLGVEPDGYVITAVETDMGTEIITNNIFCDKNMLYADTYRIAVLCGLGGDFATGISIDIGDEFLTSEHIGFALSNMNGTQIIPAGKQYRVLVYKR